MKYELLIAAPILAIGVSFANADTVKLSNSQLAGVAGGFTPSPVPPPPITSGGGVVNQPSPPPPGGFTPVPAPPPPSTNGGNNFRNDVHTFFVDLHNRASFSVLQGDLHTIRSDFHNFRR